MNVGRWMGPATLAALVVSACGAERERLDGTGGENSVAAAGASGSGVAGQSGTASAGGASGAAGSTQQCESGCAVNGGAAGTSGGAAGSGGAVNGGDGSGGAADAGSREPATVYYVTTEFSFEDASQYAIGPMQVVGPAPDRSLFVVVQTASNVITSAEHVRVNGVEATKLLSVGEDVQPSAPSALFSIPFPTGSQATVEVEMSSTVVRCAVSLFVAYGLQNIAGVDDSETIVTKTSGSMTVDVAEGGAVIAALAMAVTTTSATAELPSFPGGGYNDIMVEGTPTLILVRANDARSAGPTVIDITASDATYNFRALVAAVH